MLHAFQMKSAVDKEKKRSEGLSFGQVDDYLAGGFGEWEGEHVGRFVLASVGAIEPP
jgi:hypothetical protein